MQIFLLLALLFSLPTLSHAVADQATLYRDGALIQSEKSGKRSLVEFTLPAGHAPQSVRIRPLQGAAISRVEIVPSRPDPRREKDLANLTERSQQLRDRLQALDKRESVFLAAAKSQSSRTPKRTKANPDPLKTVQQGTEYAISQLESVNTARRRTEKELENLEKKIAALKRAANDGGAVARIWLNSDSGRARISYLMPEWKWTPAYDFRISGDSGCELVQYALLPAMNFAGRQEVSPGTLTEALPGLPMRGDSTNRSQLTLSQLQLQRLTVSATTPFSVDLTFDNKTGHHLPGGEASCFLNGEYIGKANFQGLAPGETTGLAFGK